MSYIIVMTALIIASYTDLKTMTIPLCLFPVSLLFCVVTGMEIRWNTIMLAAVVFGVYLIMAWFFQGGGGDAIMMTCLAVIFPDKIILLMFVSHLILLLFSLYICAKYKENREIPFAPIVTLSLVICTIGGTI